MIFNKYVRIIGKGIIGCILATGYVFGASLDSLVARADVIAVGSIGSRIESPNSVAFTLNVSRILNDGPASQAFDVVHEWSGVQRGGPQNINQPLFGIWFLKKLSTGGWDVLTARPAFARLATGLYIPATSVVPAGIYSYSADTPILEKVISEMGAGLEGTDDGLGKAWLLGVLNSIDRPSVTALLGRLALSGDTESQIVALAGSLARNLPSSVASLVDRWPSIAGSPSAGIVVDALRNSWRDTDPTNVRQLASFSAGLPGDSELRPAAIRALAAVHTKETLPFLASLLQTGDLSAEERGIYGLSAFANGCPAQTASNAISMDYLQCAATGQYKTVDTIAHFAFRLGTAEQESALALFWSKWWSQHPELH